MDVIARRRIRMERPSRRVRTDTWGLIHSGRLPHPARVETVVRHSDPGGHAPSRNEDGYTGGAAYGASLFRTSYADPWHGISSSRLPPAKRPERP